jgi:hypothetical protein
MIINRDAIDSLATKVNKLPCYLQYLEFATTLNKVFQNIFTTSTLGPEAIPAESSAQFTVAKEGVLNLLKNLKREGPRS